MEKKQQQNPSTPKKVVEGFARFEGEGSHEAVARLNGWVHNLHGRIKKMRRASGPIDEVWIQIPDVYAGGEDALFLAMSSLIPEASYIRLGGHATCPASTPRG